MMLSKLDQKEKIRSPSTVQFSPRMAIPPERVAG